VPLRYTGTGQVAEVYRPLATGQSGRLQARDFAMSLDNLGVCLSRLGWRDSAGATGAPSVPHDTGKY
jgi:hypothetical protein